MVDGGILLLALEDFLPVFLSGVCLRVLSRISRRIFWLLAPGFLLASAGSWCAGR